MLLPKFFWDTTLVPQGATQSEVREHNLFLLDTLTDEDWLRVRHIRPSAPALTLEQLQELGAA